MLRAAPRCSYARSPIPVYGPCPANMLSNVASPSLAYFQKDHGRRPLSHAPGSIADSETVRAPIWLPVLHDGI